MKTDVILFKVISTCFFILDHFVVLQKHVALHNASHAAKKKEVAAFYHECNQKY